jgi:hypothetical protein
MSCDIFLSYTHIKDALRGAVSEFRNHLENEVIRKTGRQLTVFQDKRCIHGGDKWAEVLRTELEIC